MKIPFFARYYDSEAESRWVWDHAYARFTRARGKDISLTRLQIPPDEGWYVVWFGADATKGMVSGTRGEETAIPKAIANFLMRRHYDNIDKGTWVGRYPLPGIGFWTDEQGREV